MADYRNYLRHDDTPAATTTPLARRPAGMSSPNSVERFPSSLSSDYDTSQVRNAANEATLAALEEAADAKRAAEAAARETLDAAPWTPSKVKTAVENAYESGGDRVMNDVEDQLVIGTWSGTWRKPAQYVDRWLPGLSSTEPENRIKILEIEGFGGAPLQAFYKYARDPEDSANLVENPLKPTLAGDKFESGDLVEFECDTTTDYGADRDFRK